MTATTLRPIKPTTLFRFLAVSLAIIGCLVVTARADTRAVYTIENIPVNEQAGTAIAAQERAFTAARLIASRRLIDKITLEEDRSAVGGVPMDVQIANRLAAAVDIVEENRGATTYRGKVSVVLNPTEVRTYLDQLGVPYVDRQAPRALLVVPAGSSISEVLPTQSDSALAPFDTFVNPAGLDPEMDYTATLRAAGAQRAIFVDVRYAGTSARADLRLWTPNGLVPLTTTPGASTPQELARLVSQTLDREWKRQAVVRSGNRTQAQADVAFTSIVDWVSLRRALVESPLVSNLQTQAVSRQGATVNFAIAGDLERFRSDMRQRGVELDTTGAGWVLRTAGFVPRAQQTGAEMSTEPRN